MDRVTYQNQSTSRSPRWDRRKDRRKEHGHQEADPRSHSRQPRFPSLGNASAGLNKGCNRRAAQQRPHGNAKCVRAIRQSRAREISRLGIHNAREARHAEQGSSAVDDVYVKKSEECENKLRGSAADIPVEDVKGVVDGLEGYELSEEVEAVVAFRCGREVRKRRVSPRVSPCLACMVRRLLMEYYNRCGLGLCAEAYSLHT